MALKLFYTFLAFFAINTTIAQNSDVVYAENDTLKIEKVAFLNVDQAAIAILDETYEPYFSKLQIREIFTLTGQLPPSTDIVEARDFAREKFSSAVVPFSFEEKEAILYTISIIKETLLKNNLNIIANHPWKFIKTEDWLCGGFAYTRGDYIILSQRHLAYITSNWSNKMSSSDSLAVIKKLGSFLVHEQFHYLKRQYTNIFEGLYVDYWNFKKVNVEADSSIVINQLTNPDAPKPEWAINYEGINYWVRTLIDANAEKPQMGKDFIDVVFTLEKKNNSFILAKDLSSVLIEQKLSDFTRYTESFPVDQGLDHPNEISSYMFSEYFLALVEGKVPFENITKKAQFSAKNYVTWLDIYFK